MWHPNENFYRKSHVAGSFATLVCAVFIVFIGLVPSLFPDIYRMLLDDRVLFVLPYLLLLALGGSVFSIWYFWIRKDV